MDLSALTALSPIDGRYRSKTESLAPYFSELALINYRIKVEIEYFIALCELPLDPLKTISADQLQQLRSIYQHFDENEAQKVKDLEKTTNHDVKAVEYYLKDQFQELGLEPYKEFIHFGLTSQDINNTAIPMAFKDAMHQLILPYLQGPLLQKIKDQALAWQDVPLLARTHGQPASPTVLGKEIQVFVNRLEKQIGLLEQLPFECKFGGATGNFNAHFAAYPEVKWHHFSDHFASQKLGLFRQQFTTQIDQYDWMGVIFDNLKRINTILLDLARDCWTYISMDYFKQKITENEVGSSAMPHKVNPIDFENGEGNLGIANAWYEHLSTKLPISRLQRDLTDSTVIRNIGMPMGHAFLAYQSIYKGLDKLQVNHQKIEADLNDQWAVLAEAIQTVLRKEGFANPYETLKDLTRTGETITREKIHTFIDQLELEEATKNYLKTFTPKNYVGKFPQF